MQIKDYSLVTGLDSSNVVLLDGNGGTKTMKTDNLIIALAESSPKIEHHINIFGGRNLGSTVTAAQLNAINDGTFKGLLVGDYWEIGGVKYRIVDMDYWWNCGDTACTTHHVVIMPDTSLYAAVMNDTNTTEGGYVNSKMRTENLEQAKTTIKAAFGENNILVHRDNFVNAVTNGKPSGSSWHDSDIELPSEVMMYGCKHFGANSDGSTIPTNYTVDKSQLALFRLKQIDIVDSRANKWLRDVISDVDFCYVNKTGLPAFYGASHIFGVCPYFGLKKGTA